MARWVAEAGRRPIPARHHQCDDDPASNRRAHWRRDRRSIGQRTGLEHVHPHVLRAAFIMAASTPVYLVPVTRESMYKDLANAYKPRRQVEGVRDLTSGPQLPHVRAPDR